MHKMFDIFFVSQTWVVPFLLAMELISWHHWLRLLNSSKYKLNALPYVSRITSQSEELFLVAAMNFKSNNFVIEGGSQSLLPCDSAKINKMPSTGTDGQCMGIATMAHQIRVLQERYCCHDHIRGNSSSYPHCYGHALNLAVTDTLKQSKICRDAFDIAF